MNGPDSVKYDASARADQQFIHDIVAHRKLFFSSDVHLRSVFLARNVDRSWLAKKSSAPCPVGHLTRKLALVKSLSNLIDHLTCRTDPTVYEPAPSGPSFLGTMSLRFVTSGLASSPLFAYAKPIVLSSARGTRSSTDYRMSTCPIRKSFPRSVLLCRAASARNDSGCGSARQRE